MDIERYLSKCATNFAYLFDRGAGLKLENRSVLPWQWCNQIKLADYYNPCTATKQAVIIDAIIPMFVRISDLCVRAWLEIVESVAFDVLLGTSFIDRCIWGVFPSECNIVS